MSAAAAALPRRPPDVGARAHHLDPRAQQARRAGARRAGVLAPRLQHREPGREPDVANGDFSRMTITCSGDPETLEQIIKQVDEADRRRARHRPHRPVGLRDRDRAGEARTAALDRADARSSRSPSTTARKVVDYGSDSLIAARRTASARSSTPSSSLLRPYGIVELVRSGKILMARGTGDDVAKPAAALFRPEAPRLFLEQLRDVEVDTEARRPPAPSCASRTSYIRPPFDSSDCDSTTQPITLISSYSSLTWKTVQAVLKPRPSPELRYRPDETHRHRAMKVGLHAADAACAERSPATCARECRPDRWRASCRSSPRRRRSCWPRKPSSALR